MFKKKKNYLKSKTETLIYFGKDYFFPVQSAEGSLEISPESLHWGGL